MCKNYFVMRVSTKRVKDKANKEEEMEQQFQQDFTRQEFVFKNAGFELTEKNTFADRITGSSKMEARPRFNELLSILEEGDTCYFVDVSRFSRDYKNGMEMIDTLLFDKKVNIVFICDNKTLYAGKRFDANEWFYISMMLLTAEYQKRCAGQMTSQKLQALKAEGVRLGRERTYDTATEETVLKLRQKGHSYDEIAERVGVSKSTVARYCRKGEKA